VTCPRPGSARSRAPGSWPARRPSDCPFPPGAPARRPVPGTHRANPSAGSSLPRAAARAWARSRPRRSRTGPRPPSAAPPTASSPTSPAPGWGTGRSGSRAGHCQ